MAVQMIEPAILKLEDICRRLGTKLLIVRSYGLIGSLRVSKALQRVHACLMLDDSLLLDHALIAAVMLPLADHPRRSFCS